MSRRARISAQTGRRIKPQVSLEQRRQRELAWLLYITEGYIANVAHALKTNAFSIDAGANVAMRIAIGCAQKTSQSVRLEMLK